MSLLSKATGIHVNIAQPFHQLTSHVSQAIRKVTAAPVISNLIDTTGARGVKAMFRALETNVGTVLQAKSGNLSGAISTWLGHGSVVESVQPTADASPVMSIPESSSPGFLDSLQGYVKGMLDQTIDSGASPAATITGAPTNSGLAFIPNIVNAAYDTYQRFAQIAGGAFGKKQTNVTQSDVTLDQKLGGAGIPWLPIIGIVFVGFVGYKIFKKR